MFSSTYRVSTSWGNIELLVRDGSAECCMLPRIDEAPPGPLRILDADDNLFSNYICDVVRGKRRTARPPLQLNDGTAFQHKVWAGIASISYGNTKTYGALAEELGCPTAIRALANACGRNPLPLFIPCHRVIAASGGVGGFSSGVAWKKHLLLHEGSLSI